MLGYIIVRIDGEVLIELVQRRVDVNRPNSVLIDTPLGTLAMARNGVELFTGILHTDAFQQRLGATWVLSYDYTLIPPQ